MNHDNCRTMTITFEGIPQEVVDYAFDQFPDRIQDEDIVGDAVEAVMSNEQVRWSRDTKSVMVNGTIIETVLRHAMYEKLEDMISEAERGDRSDFTPQQLRTKRDQIYDPYNTAVRRHI